MALTDPGGGGGTKGAKKSVGPALPAPLPKQPTMVDQAALDLAYSNVASTGLFEDQQAAYDPVTGTVRATAIDDLPRPPATYPSVPKPPTVSLRDRLQALVTSKAELKPGPGLTALSAGYGTSANIDDRRGVMPPLAPKMLGDLQRLIGQKR